MCRRCAGARDGADLFEGDRAAQMLSTLMIVMAIAPLLGPIVGGQILALAGWRGISGRWSASASQHSRHCSHCPDAAARAAQPRAADARARPLRRAPSSSPLLGYAGAGGFFYGGMFAYIAGTPFAYITYHHVPPQLYGVLFGFAVVGIMASNLANSRLVTRFGSDRLLVRGTDVAALAGIMLAVAARTGWGGLAGLVVPLFLFISAAGFIVANSIVGALADFSERAGAVSALVGAIQYGSGIIGSALVGPCRWHALADGRGDRARRDR